MLIKSAESETQASLRIQTLGSFRLWRDDTELNSTTWGREKALHLFQFLVTMRLHTLHLHKEQIIDRLWPDQPAGGGDRDFKVALHTINKVLEPERKPRTEPRFVQRHSLAYGLNLESIWIDAIVFENLIMAANQILPDDNQTALAYYQQALQLYQGDYLPERRYEDWCSVERERLQVLALDLMTTLAGLMLDHNPLESIRLTQRVLAIDPVWENAYRLQMQAFMAQGNRPMAIKIYRQCVKVLEKELGIGPLPETEALYEQITGSG